VVKVGQYHVRGARVAKRCGMEYLVIVFTVG
jgi:hypothetical protein